MKYHQNKNQNNVEETEAYDILSDQKKRKIYEQFWEEWLKVEGNPNIHSFSNRTQYCSFTQADTENFFEQIFVNHKGSIFNFTFCSNEDTKGFNQMKGEFSQKDFRERERWFKENETRSIVDWSIFYTWATL
jgi:DnaJ-class molecular chaperone